MVAIFGNSEWVTQSEGAVQSKSVTFCADMTAYFVLLAQTNVGFLSGGRSRPVLVEGLQHTDGISEACRIVWIATSHATLTQCWFLGEASKQ